MFDKFSDEAIKVIMLAQEEARILRHSELGCVHLLLGLIAIGPIAFSHRFLVSFDLDLVRVRKAVEAMFKKGRKRSPGELHLDGEFRAVLELAFRETLNKGVAQIYSEHLLRGLFEMDENAAIKVLKSLGLDRQELRQTTIYRQDREAGPIVRDGSDMSQQDAMELARGFPQVILFAMEEARRTGRNSLGTEMILLGLAGAGGSSARVLEGFGITLEFVRSEVHKIVGKGSEFVHIEIPFTPRAKRLLKNAQEEAFQLGHDTVNAGHLLLGLTHERDGVAHQVLMAQKVNLEELREAAFAMFKEKK